MALPAKTFLSVDETALALGVTTGRVRQMLRGEQLRGEKLNARAWAVYRDAVDKMLRKPRSVGPGRPRSGAA